MPTLELFVVDAFAERPFAGNPAAICLTSAPLQPRQMQTIAREMNLSETAFLLADGDAFNLRWFTPAREVELCGHATLASAHVLWEQSRLSADQTAVFSTLSGTLFARRDHDRISMDFPAEVATPCEPPPDLFRAINADVECVLINRLHYLVCVRTPQSLRDLRPDFSIIERWPRRGVIVTSPSDDDRFDFLSRYFAPAAGVNEDPVTGSAHCSLGPFWSERLGKSELVGYQASARSGVVGVTMRGSRIDLIGHAVTVMHTTLLTIP